MSEPGIVPPRAEQTAEGTKPDAEFAEARRSEKPVEVASRRTEASKTSIRPDGLMETTSYGAPVHFKDPAGKWAEIDNRLVASTSPGKAFRNNAGPVTVEFPGDLATGSVRVASGAVTLDFSLPGAKGTAQVNGDTVTYTEAFPGVDVVYRSTGSGVSKAFMLKNAQATSSIPARATVNAGTKVTVQGGEVVLRNGTDELRIPRPFAHDKKAGRDLSGLGLSGKPVTNIKADAQGDGSWLLTTSVDGKWLADSAREFPVTLDPTVTKTGASAVADCMVSQEAPTTNNCAWGFSAVGITGTGVPDRTLIQPDLSPTPSDAVIVDARLKFTVWGNTSGSNKVQARRIIGNWNATATTWNQSDVSVGANWAAPGGTFAWEPAEGAKTVTAGAGSTVEFSVPQMTQAMVADPARSNRGMGLQYQNEAFGPQSLVVFYSSDTANAAQRPQLTYTWAPRTGKQRFEQFWNQPLSDRSGVSVNLATGNLVVNSADVHQRGRLIDMSIGRVYNSRAANVGPAQSTGFSAGRLGAGWGFTTANDEWLEPIGNSITYHGASGEIVRYDDPDGDGTYTGVGQNTQLTWDGCFYHLKANDGSVTKKFFDTGWCNGSKNLGILAEVAERNGQKVTFNNNGTMYATTSMTDTYGTTATFNTNSGGTLTGISLSTGRTYGYSINATTGRLSSYTDPTGAVTNYGYYASSGLLEWIDTPRAAGTWYRTKFQYDAHGRVTAVTVYTDTTNTVGYTTQFSYFNASGTTDGYTNVVNARSKLFTYKMDPSMRVKQTVDPNGNTFDRTLNANGDATAWGPAASPGAQAQFDALTNTLTSMTSATGTNMTMTYDTGLPQTSPGRYLPKTQTDPQNNSTSFTYDPNGNLQKTTASAAPNQEVQRKIHGTTGTCVGGAVTGQTCDVTDPNGNVTVYEYTNANITKIKPPAANTVMPTPIVDTTLGYDSNNRVSSITDGQGRKCYEYDNNDRVTKIYYGAAATNPCTSATSITYTYDRAGNMTSRVDNTGTTTFEFDALSRPIAKKVNGATVNTASFDATSNLTQANGWGFTQNYWYDNGDRVTGVAPDNGSCVTSPTTLCTTLTYNNRNHRTAIVYPNGVVEQLNPDADGRTAHVVTSGPGGAHIADLTYDYRNPANLSQMTNVIKKKTETNPSVVNPTVSDYTHDNLDRLTSRKTTTGATVNAWWTYQYDKASNRTAVINSQTSAGTYYKYDGQNRLCATGATMPASCPATAPWAYTYDTTGNQLTGPGGLAFTYNNKNQTASINGTANTYADADSTERTASGSTTFTNWLTGLESTYNGSTSRYFLRTPDGMLLGTNTGTTRHWYLHDGERNIIGLTNSAGARTATYTYGDYGQNPTATGADAPINNFRYKNGWQDVAGLIKFGTRYYNPADARWNQQDPIAGNVRNPSMINRYSYVAGNPIDRWDPTGRFLDYIIDSVDQLNTVTDVIEDNDGDGTRDMMDNVGGTLAGIGTASLCEFAVGVTAAPTGGLSVMASGACAAAGAGVGKAVEDWIGEG